MDLQIDVFEKKDVKSLKNPDVDKKLNENYFADIKYETIEEGKKNDLME